MSNYLVYQGKVYDRLRREGCRCVKSESISLSSLPIDTLTVTVVDERAWDLPLANSADQLPYILEGYPIVSRLSNEGLDKYTYGEVVQFYHDGALLGKFYLESITQEGKWDWKFSCVSDIGLLNTSYHYGGLYDKAKAKDVISDIIHGIIPYSLDPSLMDVEISGHLSKNTRRNNLREVLFAIGAQVVRDANGDAVFQPYQTGLVPYEILPGAFYKSNGSVNNGTPATQALLTEHAFSARDTDEVETLFDGEILGEELVTPNGLSIFGTIIDFPEPHYDLTVTGTEILESGVNYAALAASVSAVLTGKKYTHTRRTVSRDSKAKSTPNVIQTSKNELVNIYNSASIAERLIAFYGYATTVTTDMVLTNQKPGDIVTFRDPYGHRRTGYIQTLEVNISKVLKAKATIVCDFTPPIDVPLYLHYQFFFQDGTFQVPDGVESVRVVLGQGGQGGYSGGRGENGGSNAKTYTWSDTKWNRKGAYRDASPGGKGGLAGPGGSAGRVLSAVKKVTAGETYNIHIGPGGKGAPQNSEANPNPMPGDEGGHSTFGDLTSANGYIVEDGYFEEITGATYAKPGIPGRAGGDGVGVDPNGERPAYDFTPILVPPDYVYNGVAYKPGRLQDNEVKVAQQTSTPQGSAYNQYVKASLGGLGGGATAGSNGGSTRYPDWESEADEYPPGGMGDIRGGGRGADCSVGPSAATNPGNGGDGGFGGGGGGGFGGYGQQRSLTGAPLGTQPEGSVSSGTDSVPGPGGRGGPGGDGAPGFCFVYYYSPEPN